MHVMRILLTGLAGFLLLSAGARGDDALKAVQETLKAEGFYTGEVDGTPGADTSSAIRRYQIRNGLEVTGELNPETHAALGIARHPSPTPSPEPRRAPPIPDQAARSRSTKPAPPPDVETARGDAVQELADLYRGSPFSTAPAYVRVDVLRSAQSFLRAHGYYDGDVDGIPGGGTTRAIHTFQGRQGLTQSGRLDMDTLQRMGLLPRVIGAPQYYDGPPLRRVPPPYRPYPRYPRYPPGGW